jgi:PPE-repeat protein
MAVDFGAFPPEFNSARMYAGAGPGPLLAAAAAWDGMAAGLYSSAASYSSVIATLASGWLGPSSASMAAAAAPYLAWMTTTAAQAEEAGIQAKVAAGAYETAFAATVPPAEIAANRALLMMLVATNFFGQNTPAIAATEAHYMAMWAQDASAMYGYAGSSATASSMLTPFTEAPLNTNAAGLAGQATAVAEAAGTKASTIVSTGPQMLAGIPLTLQGLSSSSSTSSGLLGGSTSSASMLSTMSQLSELSPIAYYPAMIGMRFGTMPLSPMVTRALLTGSVGQGAKLATKSLHLAGRGLGGFGGSVSAGLGRADTIGRLSVPSSWATAAPASVTSSAATTLPETSVSAAAPARTMAFMMPIANMNGRANNGSTPRFLMRPSVIPRSPIGG